MAKEFTNVTFDITPDFIHCREAAEYIQTKISKKPQIGIILGSGLGNFAESIDVKCSIDYADIPNFPRTTNPNHKGRLIFGNIEGVRVVCMQGRFHFYEGYSFEELAFPVRTLKLLGIDALIVTNAAGAVNKAYNPGDVMIIEDHINIAGFNPNRGQSYRAFGDRFYDVSNMYTKDLIKIAEECAGRTTLKIQKGVYMFFAGPNYETPAEIRAARLLGADAVGMSTTPEALCAAQCQIPLLGLSIMTNMAAGVRDEVLSDDDVAAVAGKADNEFSAYMRDIVRTVVEKYAGSDFSPEENIY